MSILKEQPIALRDVPNHLPRPDGAPIHYSTVFRWKTHGCRGRKLETYLVGGRIYTSLEALTRFLAHDPKDYVREENVS